MCVSVSVCVYVHALRAYVHVPMQVCVFYVCLRMRVCYVCGVCVCVNRTM